MCSRFFIFQGAQIRIHQVQVDKSATNLSNKTLHVAILLVYKRATVEPSESPQTHSILDKQ